MSRCASKSGENCSNWFMFAEINFFSWTSSSGVVGQFRTSRNSFKPSVSFLSVLVDGILNPYLLLGKGGGDEVVLLKRGEGGNAHLIVEGEWVPITGGDQSWSPFIVSKFLVLDLPKYVL